MHGREVPLVYWDKQCFSPTLGAVWLGKDVLNRHDLSSVIQEFLKRV